MKKILVTNDDGVHSEGIHALASALSRLGDVVIIAPHIEASAIGHALTLRRPLRMERLRDGVYEVDGTPTDCVNVAITQLYTSPPDLVVSGINKGYNLGDDVTYSGTVSGALEGSLLGIPSIAVSLQRLGMRATVQAKRNHVTVVAEREDPRGRPYYWIEEGQNDWEPHDRSDYQAVKDGFISVTPLQPDLTAHEALAFVEEQLVPRGTASSLQPRS